MRDPWSRHRELLQEGLSRCLEGVTEASGDLVREQHQASEPSDYETASLVCLAAAEAVGSSPEAAVPGAVSLALVSQMGLVFSRLETAGPSLSTAWGMPRALNAGDAFYALAQDTLLRGFDELPSSDRLAATDVLDRGGRAVLDQLQADPSRTVDVYKALLGSALALGGLLGGASDAQTAGLEALAARWAELSPDQLGHAIASDPSGWLAS